MFFLVKVNVESSLHPAELIEVDGRPLKMGIIGEDVRTVIDARRAGPGQISAQCIGPTQAEYCELLDNRDGTVNFWKLKSINLLINLFLSFLQLLFLNAFFSICSECSPKNWANTHYPFDTRMSMFVTVHSYSTSTIHLIRQKV